MELGEYLKYQPDDYQQMQGYLLSLKELILFENLDQEMEYIFSSLTSREEDLYLRYQLENVTLEAIGKQENVTRERIRQILANARTKILSRLSLIRLDYTNTSLAIAKQLEGGLSKDLLQTELENLQLINRQESRKTIGRFFSILVDNNLPQNIFEIPENVSLILDKETDFPVYLVQAIKEIPTKKFREVDRRVLFTGGIFKNLALDILGCKPVELRGILEHRGLVEVQPGWFSIRETPSVDSRQPLLQAGLKMWYYCGPLPIGTFYDGLQRYISRHYDALSPQELVRRYLEKLEFQFNEDLVTYGGKETTKLSGSDRIALTIIEEQGPVVSFQEMVNGFLKNGYSASSATSKVMSGSSVIERISLGYYKKRGALYLQEDLETAIARQETGELESVITISTDGKLRYQTALNSWSLGGVLSIGKLSEYLPDISGGCTIFVSDKACGTLSGSDNLIWGLTSAFTELNASFGDYVELEFDKKKNLKVNVKILQRRDTHV